MKKATIFLLTAVILLPSIFAFNCSLVTDNASCLIIQNETNLTISEKEYLYADLLYLNNSFPDHQFTYDYNTNLVVDGVPEDAIISSDGFIQNAWVKQLAIMPSVLENETLLAPSNIEILSAYGFNLSIPQNYQSSGYPETSQGNCRRDYTLLENTSSLVVLANNQTVGLGNLVSAFINQDSDIKSQLDITSDVQIDHYVWDSVCIAYDGHGHCIKYRRDCDLQNTEIVHNNVSISDQNNVTLEDSLPEINFTLVDNYSNTFKAVFSAENYSTFRISFNNSYMEQQAFEYSVVFTSKPYYVITLKKQPANNIKQSNLVVSQDTLWTANISDCVLSAYNDFNSIQKPCDILLQQEETPTFTKYSHSTRWALFWKILLFFLAVYLILLFIRKQGGKKLIPIAILLLFIPLASADCGITNIASCIPEKIYEFVLGVINSPLQPLLTLVKGLLELTPPIELFLGIWSIIVYVLSMFYAFLFMYSGFQFMTSGLSSLKRYLAKEWLKNTFLLIVFVQASFYLYGLILDLGSMMTSAVLQLVDPHFFMLTVDNLANIGLEFIFALVYALILFITVILLTIRFMMVVFGVLFAPIGIFCYFIPPLRSYGKFILNVLGMLIFITFIDGIIFLASSWIVEIPFFANFKILVMICSFLITDYLMIKLMFLVIAKSSFEAGKEQITEAVKYIAMMAG